mmetsp:Transcript_8587/g.21640  ORF Transcript_8587/g.21640 Transcript_8587/m.21640 type:complete len:420 (-) Transcript_8587:97-1356(-)
MQRSKLQSKRTSFWTTFWPAVLDSRLRRPARRCRFFPQGQPPATLLPCDLAMTLGDVGRHIMNLHFRVGDLVAKGVVGQVSDAVRVMEHLVTWHMDLGVSLSTNAADCVRLQQEIRACGQALPSLVRLATWQLCCDGAQSVLLPPVTLAGVIDAWVGGDQASGRETGIATVSLTFPGLSVEVADHACRLACSVESAVPDAICKSVPVLERMHRVEVDVTGLKLASCKVVRSMSAIGFVEDVKIRSPVLEITKSQDAQNLDMQYFSTSSYPSFLADSVIWFSKVNVETLHLKLHGQGWFPPSKIGFRCCVAADAAAPKGNAVIVNHVSEIRDLRNLVVDVGETPGLDFAQQQVAAMLQQLENLQRLEILVEKLGSQKTQFKLAEGIQKAVGADGSYIVRARSTGLRIAYNANVAIGRGPG